MGHPPHGPAAPHYESLRMTPNATLKNARPDPADLGPRITPSDECAGAVCCTD
jgi:hypothetical protein